MNLRGPAILIVLALLGFLVVAAIRTVPAGHVGVVDLFGRVSDETLPPGIHLVNPLAKVPRMTIQTREIKEVMDTPSREGLSVHLELSLLFHLDFTKAVDVYKTVGMQYATIIVEPNFRSAVREITSTYDAKTLYSSERDRLGQEIAKLVSVALNKRGVQVEAVLMRQVGLPAKVKAAIEEKLSAEQDAARMEFVLLKEKQEAERKKIEADGIASFQRIVSEGINENLLRWKGIETTKDLALSPNSKIVIIGSGSDGLPLILGGDTPAAPAARPQR